MSSPSVRRALRALGANLKTARLKRRIGLADFAERIGVSKSTVIRLEKGDEGVSIGTLTMACLVLGELDQISGFLDPGSDHAGLLMEKDALPKRINRPRKSGSSGQPGAGRDDDEWGVGF